MDGEEFPPEVDDQWLRECVSIASARLRDRMLALETVTAAAGLLFLTLDEAWVLVTVLRGGKPDDETMARVLEADLASFIEGLTSSLEDGDDG